MKPKTAPLPRGRGLLAGRRIRPALLHLVVVATALWTVPREAPAQETPIANVPQGRSYNDGPAPAAKAISSATSEPALLPEARQALAENLPQITVAKLERLLSEPQLAVASKDAATLLLARAHYDLREFDEALSRIRPLVARSLPGALVLQAHTLSALGQWKEAQANYHLLSQGGAGPLEAVLGEAEAQQALGRSEEALVLFRAASHRAGEPPLLQLRIAVLLVDNRRRSEAEAILARTSPQSPLEQKWKSYLEGRLLLLRDQPAPALTLFEDVSRNREHLPESLNVAAVFGATEARIALYGPEQADKELERFIWRNPNSPHLDRAFQLLDQVYAREDDPPESEYHRWVQKEGARAGFARFYVARLQARKGKVDKATLTLQTFVRTYPDHPLLAEAYLLLADLLSQQRNLEGNFEEAARALDGAMRHTEDVEVRAEIELRSGLIHFQQGEYLLAAGQFEAAAKRSGGTRSVATFDSALSWLARQNFERFREDFQSFVKDEPGSPLRPELQLEEGLARARTGDPGARKSLEGYLQQYPQDRRHAEARLALAELTQFTAKDSGSPRAREEANQYLRTVSAASPEPEVQAQADYLAIWLGESQEPQDTAKVIALAREFLVKHPQSAFIAPVRMKLGQLYFNREDYANAETYFTQLVQLSPESELAEPALFLSGQSAAKLMNTGAVDRALAAFDAVVKREGPLKLYARQEQANIQSRLSHEDQAIALYDLILGAEPAPDAQLRQATLCGKADSLLTLGRRENSADRIGQAIAVYDELAGLPEVTSMWRNQALFKKGKALEQLGRTADAILAYYDVLHRSAAGEREYFWLYKAGFEAARLFELQEQWKSAVAICEKMAAFEGPRSAEAKARLKQLRLDHYLWD